MANVKSFFESTIGAAWKGFKSGVRNGINNDLITKDSKAWTDIGTYLKSNEAINKFGKDTINTMREAYDKDDIKGVTGWMRSNRSAVKGNFDQY